MNKTILIGRLIKDPEVRYTADNTAIARLTLAVDRKYKKEGQQDADFIGCISFGKTAEFIEKYFKKGMKVAAEGRIQTGSYEKDGTKHYTTDVVIENAEFCEKKDSNGDVEIPLDKASKLFDIPQGVDEEIPFV